jgi:hypothetical membrane protein
VAAGSRDRPSPDRRPDRHGGEPTPGSRGERPVSIAPALILAILVGVFHASLYVLIRGSGGGRLPIIVIASILGAWAGDALGDRLGMELLTIGDFHLIAASIVAWVGIAISSAVAVLAPQVRRT